VQRLESGHDDRSQRPEDELEEELGPRAARLRLPRERRGRISRLLRLGAGWHCLRSYFRGHTHDVAEPTTWNEVDGALERTFSFADFAEALAFVNRVGELAEAENHHPDIRIDYSKVTLRWWTHTAGGVTDRDRELATRSGSLVVD
jgi:4a-hydroxytetrahydrobiopterin dehydratase